MCEHTSSHLHVRGGVGRVEIMNLGVRPNKSQALPSWLLTRSVSDCGCGNRSSGVIRSGWSHIMPETLVRDGHACGR